MIVWERRILTATLLALFACLFYIFGGMEPCDAAAIPGPRIADTIHLAGCE
jgi:hypothetical protein